MLLLLLVTAGLAKASCVTEFGKIVKTPLGHVKTPRGEAVSGAEIEVESSAEDTVFTTRSARDGSVLIATKPGKYRVKVSAEGYLEYQYVADLRHGASVESFDVWLQELSQCHDVRVVTNSGAKEEECSSEVLRPNLVLGVRTIISGQVKDETGAPFKQSEIELKKLSDSVIQPARLETKTDEEGRFTFEEAEPGNYRLLASSTRAFAQPERLVCTGLRDCRLEIVLKGNGTDLPYASCPIQ